MNYASLDKFDENDNFTLIPFVGDIHIVAYNSIQ